MQTRNLAFVSKAAFRFCKGTIAVLLWLALLFHIKWLLVLTFLLLASGAVLGVQRAPLVLLYTHTINRRWPSADEMLDVNGIRFAQGLGATLSLFCLAILYFGREPAGWGLLLVIALLKTSGALGFCTGLKLYQCLFPLNTTQGETRHE